MNAWTMLGIAPTVDQAAIRRAYARRLKVTRPEDDPEGFQRLLRAREIALGEAAEREELGVDDTGDPDDESASGDRPLASDDDAQPADETAAAADDLPPPPAERIVLTHADDGDRPPL